MCLFMGHLMPICFLSVLGSCLPLPPDTLMFDVWGDILNYYIYLGYLDLAVWRCYISFLFRWNGSDVLLYGGLHTYSFVYVVDPFACRLRRPYRSRWIGSGWDGRKVYPWVAFGAPPYYFNHYRSSRLVSRSVIHRGSYNWYQSHPALQGLSQMVVVSLANIFGSYVY